MPRNEVGQISNIPLTGPFPVTISRRCKLGRHGEPLGELRTTSMLWNTRYCSEYGHCVAKVKRRRSLRSLKTFAGPTYVKHRILDVRFF